MRKVPDSNYKKILVASEIIAVQRIKQKCPTPLSTTLAIIWRQSFVTTSWGFTVIVNESSHAIAITFFLIVSSNFSSTRM